MAAYVKYQVFAADIGLKKDQLNTDTLKVALTNTAPNVVTHALLADITEITAQNGYSAGGGTVTASAFSQSGGTGTVTGTGPTFTSSGAGFGPFRYAVLYDSTATNGPLIAYWDYGSSITPANGETFVVTLGANIFTLV